MLRFAASFLWADLVMLESEREFLARLACELGLVQHAREEIDDLLRRPPAPEHVDPNDVPPLLAADVRRAALRAIAADGRVARAEMRLFHLLDELLPNGPAQKDDATSAPSSRSHETASDPFR